MPKNKTIEELHQKTGISKKTLRMIDSGMEALENGEASDPIDLEEDFPSLFNSNQNKDGR